MPPKLERAARIQGLVFCILAACTSVASWGLPRLAPPVELGLLVGLIVTVGVPHGAVDSAYLSLSFQMSRWREWAAFAARYLALAAAVLALWVVWPAVGLGAFLFMSAVHFSGDPVRGATMATRALQGSAVIVLPALWHSVETEMMLGYLAGASAAARCLSVLQPLALPLALFLGLAAVVELRRGRVFVAAEAAATVMVAIAAPPLVGFTVYFCGMHSARHLLRTAERARLSWLRLALVACVPMLGTVATGFVAWRLMAQLPVDAVAIRIVFIGLAALTVPHMVIVERVRFARLAA